MTDPKVYQFSVVPAATLSEGDPRDPFRFYHDGEAKPVQGLPSGPGPHIEVIDTDQNRQLTSSDRYFYVSPDGRRLELDSEEGLKLLNFWADPSLLKKSGSGLVVHSLQDLSPVPEQTKGHLKDISEISPSLRDVILDSHFPYWEADSHLDMNILEGVRLYTSEENDRWTGPRGVGIFFTWKGFAHDVFVYRVFEIGGAFQGLEHFISPSFTWHMFTNNFLSMVGGSFSKNTRSEGNIEAWNYIASHREATNSVRRLANIRTAEARAQVANKHLQMTYTWSVVALACFADPNFRKFWPAPWRWPKPGIVLDYFSDQLRTSVAGVGRNPLGLGLALTSAFGLYEVSSAWFDAYGDLPYHTTENRVFSLASTFLVEGALLSKASKEMRAFTGSGELTLANLQKIPALKPRFSLGVAIEEIPAAEKLIRISPNRLLAKLIPLENKMYNLPEGYRLARANFFGLRVPIIPKPTVMATWKQTGTPVTALASPSAAPATGSAATEASLLESGAAVRPTPLPSLAQAGQAGAVVEEGSLVRVAAATRAGVAGETVLSRVALTTAEGRTFAVSITEGMTAEEMMLGGRTRVFGMPLLGAASMVGVSIAFLYATGYYNSYHTPRDTIRELFGK